MSGHLFVVRSDILSLACDARLLPTDRALHDCERWVHSKDRCPPLPAAPSAWTAGEPAPGVPRVLEWPGFEAGLPRVFLGWIGRGRKVPVSWFVDGARQFVEHAARRVAAQGGRARPLLALPVVGTGFGGAYHRAGEVVKELVPALVEEARERAVDVALVAFDAETYDAAQAERRRLDAFDALPAPLVEEAGRLARLALDGQLVLFVGSGMSSGAGVPTWKGLLDHLAARVGFSAEDRAALAGLDPLDCASILERRARAEGALEVRAEAAAALLRASRFPLAQALLASLPVREVVTTNYDTLFEQASEAAGRRVNVIPDAPERAADRWLLKLHGCVTRPAEIVLTREDYLRFGGRRGALAGIVQAHLLTRHILFAGFSLADPNFHAIMDSVRCARAASSGGSGPVGTALFLDLPRLTEALWEGELRIVRATTDGAASAAEAARRIEVLLDLVGMEAAESSSHLLATRFDGALDERDAALRRLLDPLAAEAALGGDRTDTRAWRRVLALLRELGWQAPPKL